MSVYFTSDQHFGHANIIKYSNRPFKHVFEMNEELIRRWNEKITNDDVVYTLGDMFLCDVREAENIFNRLNGKEIHYIRGNHDKTADKMRDWFTTYNKGFSEVSINRQMIVLCHYSMNVWNKSHRGTWHLYGHSHGSLPDNPNSLSFDCGVDSHNYYPLSFDEVKRIIDKKTFKAIDHHGRE